MSKTYAEGVLKERIVNALRQHPEGLTTQDISRLIGSHRHTATRYLAELKGAGIVHYRPIGSANLHYLKDGLKLSSQRELSKLVCN